MTETTNRGDSSSGVVGRRGALTWPLLLVAALCLVALVALFGGRGAGAQTAAVPTEEDGSVVGWGLNTSGQTTIPTGLSGVKAIAAGGSHSLALKDNGSVVAWGYNENGRATVPDGASSGVKAIAGGTAHSLALKEDGSVVAWGYNEYGQTDVPTAAQSGVKAIDAGFLHSLALKEDGSVVAWGFYYGRGFATVPTAAQSGVKAIASGDDHSLALKEDGSVVAWGFNDFGQGTVTIVPDGAKSGVKAIAGGGKHSLALKEDGSVVAWGSNGQGQTTVPDGAKSGVKAIAGGLYHSLALKEDGSVVAWGYNENGQTTVPDGASSGIGAIAGGDYHSLALTTPVVVDTTAPNTAISNGPTEGSTVTSTNQAFSFTSTESGSTFKCSINGAVVFSACSAGDTFAFAEGSNTFEVKATDTAGNEDPSPATRAFTVDTIAPDAPSITSPDDNSFDTDGAITLSGAAEADSTVEVFEGDASRGSTTANGSGEWTKTLTNVADGSHTYKAKATDAVGNASGFSNPRTVTVDTAAPDTTIISGPTEGAKVNATSQAFSFDSTEAGSTFECSVNGAAFSACSTGETLTFTEGSNTFEVVATDAAGNEDSSAATRTFTVDTTAPDTIITDGPSGTVKSDSATFEFSSTEDGSTFECSLDGATFAACDAPRTLSDLSDGSHTFSVRAKDAAGNTDASPATQTWIVDTTTPDDTTAPTVSAKTPTGTGVARNTNVSATFSERMDEASIEAAGTVKLVLAGKKGKTTPVAASVTYNPDTKTVTLDPATNLGRRATYTVTITTAAKDEAGNALARPETWTFTTGAR